jgi:RNA polymerase sigma factor (sigma-70 family)
MARPSAQTDLEGPSPRIDDLDPKTLRFVQAYLAPGVDRSALGPRYRAAWERFEACCVRLIGKLVWIRAGQAFDHEDWAQEIWIAVVTDIGHYDPERGPFSRWLAGVARHVLDEQKRSCHPMCHLQDEMERELPGREPDPATSYDLDHSQQGIESTIEPLRPHVSEANFRILHDHWVEGKSFEQIALSLGLTVKQVRDHHHRMLGKLRELRINHGE